MKKNIAIFGLGSMGFGIAKSCIDNGHKVWGFDISRRTINKFKKIGGAIDTFDKIAKNLDMVFLVVLNAKQVKSIFTKDPGILKILPKEKLVINCVTNSPKDAAWNHTIFFSLPISIFIFFNSFFLPDNHCFAFLLNKENI